MAADTYLDKETQQALTPKDVYIKLVSGNARFFDNTFQKRDKVDLLEGAAAGQNPMAIILGCIDSRVLVEKIFDVDIGDIFVSRVAGNVINPDQLASMEYACKVAGSKLIVVLGHSDCGAVKSAIAGVELGNITSLLSKIKPAVDGVSTKALPDVIKHNVAQSVAEIYKKSDILRELIDTGDIGVIGAVYDVSSGQVVFYSLEEELQAYLDDSDKLTASIGAII